MLFPKIPKINPNSESQNQLQCLEEKVETLTEKLLESFDELNILYDTTRSLAKVYNAKEIVEVALAQVEEILHPEKAAIFMLHDSQYITIISGYGFPPYFIGRKVEIKDTVYDEVVKRRRSLLTDDIKYQRPPVQRDLLALNERLIFHPACLIPMMVNEEVIGIASLSHKRDKQPFTARDVKFLITIATQTAFAIQTAQLVGNLKKSFLVTVRALSAAIDAKDAYTHGHSERVSEYALGIGQTLGMSQSELEQLELASLLHDVGKIGIPENILNKKGPLSPQEMDIVRQHTLKGVEILNGVSHMDTIITAVRNHHERYDGRGYPDGLSHEQIPLLAKIIAIADSFDAMTSDRPYRSKCPEKKAIREIEDNSGSMYDPKMVWAFTKWIQEKRN